MLNHLRPSAATIAIVLVLIGVAVLLARAGHDERPAQAGPLTDCGDTRGSLNPSPRVSVFLVPDYGAPDDPFNAILSGVSVDDFSDQEVEVLWEWDHVPPPPTDALIGEGVILSGQNSAVVDAAVPSGLPTGTYTVTICWLFSPGAAWYYVDVPFEVLPPATPSPTPSDCMTVRDVNETGITAADLAAQLVGSGITISNVVYTGAFAATGRFNDSCPAIGFDSGIVLGSGNVVDVIGPNTNDAVSGDHLTPWRR